MISSRLIKSSFIYTIIGALPLFSAFLLLIFYTNYLTRDDYGALVIFISFTGLIQVLINLGMDGYIGVVFFENRAEPGLLRQAIGQVVGYLMIWGAFIIFSGLLMGENLFSILFQGKDIFFYPYGFMSVITAFCNSFFKTYTNLLINQEKVSRFAAVNFANFVMTVGFSLTGLFLYPYTLIGPMWGRLLSGLGIFLIALVAILQSAVFRYKVIKAGRVILRHSLPVMVYLLIAWSISSIYPFIMKRFMSLSELAIFGLALQFTLLVEFFLNGVSNAIAPKVYALIMDQKLDHSTPELNKYMSGFNAISLLLIPASTFFIPLILPLLISKDYEASFLFLSILNIGFATRGLYNYFLNPFYLLKKTRLLPVAYGFTAAFQIFVSIILIKYYGIWGAVASTILTKVFQNLFLWLFSRKFFSYQFSAFKFIWLPLFIISLVIFSEYFVSTESMHLIRLLQMVITYLLVCFFYRHEIAELLLSLKLKFLK
jgi:O-antigen/teichoic acid export membrane protein